jgi:hypothetical protein
MEARRNAGMLFTVVYGRARWRAFTYKLLGWEYKLKNLGNVSAIKRLPAKKAGIVTVSLDKIVGSEGRAEDFDNNFVPLTENTLERWVSILVARRSGCTLPPVTLIQVDDKYYVHDGHHRISVANAIGQKEIEAKILYSLKTP